MRSYVYDHEPLYTYSYMGLPCDFQMEGDKSVNFTDFLEK